MAFDALAHRNHKINGSVHRVMDWIFVVVTAAVAWHALRRERSVVHLLFGCIALLFCLRVLLIDLLGVHSW